MRCFCCSSVAFSASCPSCLSTMLSMRLTKKLATEAYAVNRLSGGDAALQALM